MQRDYKNPLGDMYRWLEHNAAFLTNLNNGAKVQQKVKDEYIDENIKQIEKHMRQLKNIIKDGHADKAGIKETVDG